MEILIG